MTILLIQQEAQQLCLKIRICNNNLSWLSIRNKSYRSNSLIARIDQVQWNKEFLANMTISRRTWLRNVVAHWFKKMARSWDLKKMKLFYRVSKKSICKKEISSTKAHLTILKTRNLRARPFSKITTHLRSSPTKLAASNKICLTKENKKKNKKLLKIKT